MNQAIDHDPANNRADSNCYIHDGSSCFRFDIEGDLSGRRATEMEQSWRTAETVIGSRPLVVALGKVDQIDSFGRALLHRWHEAGARFTGKSPLVRSLVGSIVREPVTCGSATDGKRGGLSRYARALRFTAQLHPTTLKRWEDRIDAANLRMEQRLSPGKCFLWVDEAADRLATVQAGEAVISPVGPPHPSRVPSGLIHDWIAAAFIRNATIGDVLQVANDYGRFKQRNPPAVAESTSIARDGSSRLSNGSLFMKTALDSDYESCSIHLDDQHVYSVARTTRVQAIEEYGVTTGIISRLFTITRFVERDGGVYLEIEALGLTRDIPVPLRWLLEPIIRRVSRASLSATLWQIGSAAHLRRTRATRRIAGADTTVAFARHV